MRTSRSAAFRRWPTLLGENREHVRAEPLEARPRAVASQLSTEAGVEDEQRACLTEERPQAVAQIVEPVGGVDAERHPQDDLEGDRLKARVQRELSTDWPRREVAPSDGLHRVGVALEGLRSKGASEQPPLTGVNLAVLAEHGLRNRGTARASCCPFDELVRLQAEDVPYRGRVGDNDRWFRSPPGEA